MIRAAWALALAISAAAPAAAQTRGTVAPAPQCGGPAPIVSESIALRRTAAHVGRARALAIVAIGSGSTAGAGASGPDAAWPARMAERLRERLPGIQVSVTNLARPRALAEETARRLAPEVLPLRPQLVIWETGTSDAVRQIDQQRFLHVLLRGIDRLDGAGIDAILMDPQYERVTARLINFEPYIEALNGVVAMRDVGLFRRNALMREWAEADGFAFEGGRQADHVAVADAAYACVGQLVADAIARALRGLVPDPRAER